MRMQEMHDVQPLLINLKYLRKKAVFLMDWRKSAWNAREQ